ncbi:Protein of unknown function [Kytococcus aerolatus]|uniref:DUF3027 domain-containing protein n=1 Tax=Kytococcus aerolatus TaxID=592308 RepID=A0A212TCN6_9MICO|nr:DUF3027 domain-containing protein [Kytococcus aerolatus]SNC63808.1 Protein of unknown function [Kytococcus aerolatus]
MPTQTPTQGERNRAARGDQTLMSAVGRAREALHGVAAPGAVGGHTQAYPVAERLVTHVFECLLPGYVGWQWEVTVARAPRSKRVTVCETHLVPGDGALLSPEWVPWAERVRPEDLGAGQGGTVEEPQLVLVAAQNLSQGTAERQSELIPAVCECCDTHGFIVPVEIRQEEKAGVTRREPDPLPPPLVDDYEIELVDPAELRAEEAVPESSESDSTAGETSSDDPAEQAQPEAETGEAAEGAR